ncbi:wax ester/triacylglycerol synthase domain-containing protein [Kitasatospora viridis]|nr:wax ester/triacylglycerol synthase domain-containing protein [Kitasatospora viridis]
MSADGLPCDDAPMAPQDAWLYRQQRRSAAPAPIGLVAWFAGPAPDLDRLRELADRRLGGLERLRLVPRTAPTGWPHWVLGGRFAVERHVLAGSGNGLEVLVGELAAAPLPTGLPPWQLHLLPAAGGFALLLRAHHALLDGVSLNAVLDLLLGVEPAEPVGPAEPAVLPGPVHPAAPGPVRRARRLAWLADDLLPKGLRLPIHGSPGTGRRVCFATVDAAELAAARAALPGTRCSGTAVFLAATAGALDRLELLGRGRGATALVPIDARPGDERALLGNHYATVRIPLPVRAERRARLAALADRTARDRLLPRALAQAATVAGQPHRVTAAGAVLSRYLDSSAYFSLLCSSLPAPAGPDRVLGSAQLVGLSALPPLGPAHPVALTLHHHPTGATLAAVTDDRFAHLAAPLAAAVRTEIALLAAR